MSALSESSQEYGTLDKQYVDTLQQEQPSIYLSVKNLCAFVLGSNLHVECTSSDNRCIVRPLSSTLVMQLAKVLLQNISNYELPPVSEYSTTFPQGASQPALDRLDEIGKYKAVHQLRGMAVKGGGKVTWLFGKSYLLWSRCWPLIRQRTRDAFANSEGQKGPGPSDSILEDVDRVLDIYEASLGLEKQKKEGTSENDQPIVGTVLVQSVNASVSDNSDLIWAADFNCALQRRQHIRKQSVESRLAEVSADENTTPDDDASQISPSERVVELPSTSA